eukprot:gnl/TRDRNA2_/TRDRNA2_162454_c0_seq9.p1 gnl/TRDRNA2_/TRDRNA2_162454_c0~~gnl/TRDRNA2_/TRDRNA2_162454_c0_seq9.p1  ORF type:complete len:240 (+),score=21.76 gnl/TRDRNA2_/TRDRNA2_162454_c0_seq9:105-824(+)
MPHRNVLDDFLAGCIAGAGGTLVTHPLDTLVLRLQSTSGLSAVTTAAIAKEVQTTLRLESSAAFLRGITLPCLSAGAARALAFGGAEATRACLPPQRIHGRTTETFACGAVGGFLASLVHAPIERTKRCAQVHRQPAGRGVLATEFLVARDIIANNSIVDLFRGWRVMACGSSLTYGLWFALNEVFVGWAAEHGPVGGMTAFVCGGLAGCISKIFHSPFDALVWFRMLYMFPMLRVSSR